MDAAPDSSAGGPSFAATLRGLREARALTQEELAERAGITVKAVGALERGERRRPYPHTVRSLAEALELAEDERDELFALVPSRRAGTTATVAVPATAADATPTPLGASATPLVGREDEVSDLVALVASGRARLLTITGPGGVGKTRLSLEVATRCAPEFSGVAVVELAALREPSLVLSRLAAALGVPETVATGTVAGLAPYLLGRRLLVVLDNLEQVVASGPDIADLVARCPELVVLVTSRAPLRVRAEHEVPLPPLTLPETDDGAGVEASPAVAMFLDRAAAAGTTIVLTEDNVAVVAEICRRLSGLPLALELAAAGTRVLTPEALLARLEGGLERASEGPRDLPDRQRTMSAAIDWSIDLLEPEEEALFDRLAVFSDGFSLDSVEAVAEGNSGADTLTGLSVLVEQALVLRAPEPDAQPRFRLLEPVRQHAVRRIAARRIAARPRQGRAEAMAGAERHAAHFRDRALDAHQALHGDGLETVLDRLQADHANLRSAFLRLLELDRLADAADLAGSVWLYLGLRGHAREGLAWLDRLVPGQPTALPDVALGRALTGRMGLLLVTGDVEGMRKVADRAVTASQRAGLPALAGEAATLAAHAAVFAGDLTGATPLLESALRLSEETAESWVAAHALVVQGQQALVAGDLTAADEVLDRALAAGRALGNAFTVAVALNCRATLTELTGDDVATAASLGESTELSVRARLGWTLGYALPALASVAVRVGEARTAALLFGASASLTASDAVDARFPVSRALSEEGLAAARDQLGDEAFRTAWDAGRSATRTEIAELARDLTRLARG